MRNASAQSDARPPPDCTSARGAPRSSCSRPAGSRPAIAATGASGGAAPSASGSATRSTAKREIDAFDEELDFGTQALSEVLKALEHENMQYVADTFAAALAADLITADDFR